MIGAGATRLPQSRPYVEGLADASPVWRAAMVMFVIGGLAACLPARRAVRVDPATVLREQ